MVKIMDPTLPIFSILRYWAIVFGPFGGPGIPQLPQPPTHIQNLSMMLKRTLEMGSGVGVDVGCYMRRALAGIPPTCPEYTTTI